MRANAAILWLHDLDTTPTHELSDFVSQTVPYASWTFPEADEKEVTALGKKCAAWFDVPCLPVESLLEAAEKGPSDRKGLTSAVSSLHQMIEELVASGVQNSRIVLGGTGQGGAVAMIAALQVLPKPRPLFVD